jgi:hypothetical protein
MCMLNILAATRGKIKHQMSRAQMVKDGKGESRTLTCLTRVKAYLAIEILSALHLHVS